VPLTSIPPVTDERWWTKLAKLPGRLWSMSLEMATMMTDGSHRQPTKRKLLMVRLGVMASLLVLLPLLLPFRSRLRRPTAFDALHARIGEIWQTSPDDGMALLRTTFRKLVAEGAFEKMKSVEITPFGSFKTKDVLSVYRVLYECEVGLGNYEQALAVLAVMPGRIDSSILQQVDCLVALGRRDEAIALLERNLDIDGWRGKLRRRLRELGGRHLRAVP